MRAEDARHALESIARNKQHKATATELGWFGARKRPVQPVNPYSALEGPQVAGTPPVRVEGAIEPARARRDDCPETPADAETWNRTKNHALGAGLCYRCACQFAYGVQHGFAAVEVPGEACKAVMATWPIERVNGWRSPDGRAHSKATWKGLNAPSTRTQCKVAPPVPPEPTVRVEACLCCDIPLSALYPTHDSPLWHLSENEARTVELIGERRD